VQSEPLKVRCANFVRLRRGYSWCGYS